MARFICICRTCQHSYHDSGAAPEQFEELVLFETGHGINATPEEIAAALVCPRCDGTDCEKTLLGYDIVGYVRGDGYLDKVGAKRDMSLFHLTATDAETGETLDPYAQYRVPGEVDDLKARIARAGKHNPKPVYGDLGSTGMQEAVATAVTPTPE